MRVIVLGGAGDMARRAARDLVQQQDVEQLTIADINQEAAASFARELNDPRVDNKYINAEDHRGMVDILRGYQVACGAVGPFYRFEKKVAKACIEAGVDYVSICDDHDAIKEVLSLHQEAEANRVKVMPGLGWTPGLSNLLAKKGYEELTSPQQIKIYWGGSSKDSQGFAVILHTLHIFSGKVPSFRGGREVEVEGGSEPEQVDFGPPLGMVWTYHVGHPEPITIPQYLAGLEQVSLKGGLKENYLNTLTRFMARVKLTNSVGKKQLVGKGVNLFMPLLSKLDSSPGYSGIRVDVMGSGEKGLLQISYRAVDHMNNLTGIPLSVGGLMLGRGEVGKEGVFPPEGKDGITPDRFLDYLQQRGIQVSREEKLLNE